MDSNRRENSKDKPFVSVRRHFQERRLIRDGVHGIEHFNNDKDCETESDSLGLSNSEVVTRVGKVNSREGVNAEVIPLVALSPGS